MFTVYDGIYAYVKRANSGLYLGCKTSIFNDPSNQIFTNKAKEVMVRQYSSGKAGSYDKSKGWGQTYGTGRGLEWYAYNLTHDRAKVLSTDAIFESVCRGE